LGEAPLTHDSDPVACWRPNDALVEAGERQLVSREAHHYRESSLSYEDALSFKLFGVEQSAPRDLTEAFDRIFGKL
jgi:hypothetical protein